MLIGGDFNIRIREEGNARGIGEIESERRKKVGTK